MRVAIIKPDFGLTGGFETVMGRIEAHLNDGRHDVVRLPVDCRQVQRQFAGKVSQVLEHRAPEFVNYIALVDAIRRIDVRRADMVISSQPPSFAVEHPRHLSVFYHHHRIFYDLDDVARRAHLVDDTLQRHAVELVRGLDQPMLDAVSHILAGSEEVAQRLATYNARADGLSTFHAGVDCRHARTASGRRSNRHPLCVSRHEFPKRTELFVQAMKLLPDLEGTAVGSGGRLGYVQHLDAELTIDPDGPAACNDAWLTNPGYVRPLLRPTPGSNVTFTGEVSEQELLDRYQDSSCVVAPAYLEDYGLTVLEAMAFGRPVVVCRDGGYLTHLVVDGVNGLVVDPDAVSLAQAIRRLHDDPVWAEQLGEAGRDVAAGFTWDRAFAEFDVGVEQVMS